MNREGESDMKEIYISPEMEIILVEHTDVITSSTGEDETPFVPYSNGW